jgi:hypothetical protein
MKGWLLHPGPGCGSGCHPEIKLLFFNYVLTEHSVVSVVSNSLNLSFFLNLKENSDSSYRIFVLILDSASHSLVV